MQKFILEERKVHHLTQKNFEKLEKNQNFEIGDLELMTLFCLTFLLKYTLQKSNED